MIAKASALLAVVSLTLLSPALTACACVDCGAKQASHAGAAHGKFAAKSCCRAKPGQRSCCGSTDGCRCGVQHHATANEHADDHAPSCNCIAQAPPRVVATKVSSLEHSAAAQLLAGYVAILAVRPPELRATLPVAPHDLPPPHGGLRIHAFYGVWLI
jgi:hypothetical protein